ncbi:MAG: iduronate-2-sulfatase [Leeuwenhoekiella sp.]|nr:MAG: iduronate-2-sulfatase [Leeuwenhoekiella sp.]
MKSIGSINSVLIHFCFLLFVFSPMIAQKNTGQKPNILLLCVDDLRPELNSFGKSYIHSPHIDNLAKDGVMFTRHYVNSPSCGPSRYTLLTGTYGPSTNNALFKRTAQLKDKEPVVSSMPGFFKSKGYTTIAIGKVSHHPGGFGGPDWDDSTQVEMPGAWSRQLLPVGEWQHPRGIMHGLAHGEIREDASQMDVYQSTTGTDSIYPDGLIASEAVAQLKNLKDQQQPFFMAVGLLKPHLPFGAPKKYYDLYANTHLPDIENPSKPEGKSTWHESGEFRQYNLWGKDPVTDTAFATEVRKHYAACVSYADAQVGEILEALKESGLEKNTIVVLWGDHGWHLGEHSVWGKHTLFEEALHSPLILKYPGVLSAGIKTEAIVESIDLFPTLCQLTKLDTPAFVQGQSFHSILNRPGKKGHPALAYYNGNLSLRTDDYRLIIHKDGFKELYAMNSPEKESQNCASDMPEVVAEMTRLISKRIDELTAEYQDFK